MEPEADAAWLQGMAAFHAGCQLLVSRYYFYASLLTAIPKVATSLVPVAMVDLEGRLYYNPLALSCQGVLEVATILWHELEHIARRHGTRLAAQSAADHHWANLAADAEINDDAAALGLAATGLVLPQDYGWPPHETAEYYFQHRPPAAGSESETARRARERQQTAPGCGSGATGYVTEAEEEIKERLRQAGALPDPPTQAELHQALEEYAVRILQAGCDSLPGSLVLQARRLLSRRSFHWRQVLAAYVGQNRQMCPGAADYTFRRPSRRRQPRLILPGLCGYRTSAAVVLDTSGSMVSLLPQALAQLEQLLELLGTDTWVYIVDTQVQWQGPAAARPEQWPGGGGTDMGVGIQAAAARRPPPDLIIVLTDGVTPWPPQPPPVPVLVALLGSEPPEYSLPPWAAAVRIPGW